MLLPILMAYADAGRASDVEKQPTSAGAPSPATAGRLFIGATKEVGILFTYAIFFYDVVTLPELANEFVRKYQEYVYPIYDVFPGLIIHWFDVEFTEIWRNIFTAFLITSTAANIETYYRSNTTFYGEFTSAFVRQQIRIIKAEYDGNLPVLEWAKWMISKKYETFWGYYFDITKIAFMSLTIFLIGQKLPTQISIQTSAALALVWFLFYLFYILIYTPLFWNFVYIPMTQTLPNAQMQFLKWYQNMKSKFFNRILVGIIAPFLWIIGGLLILVLIPVLIAGLIIDLVIVVPAFMFTLIALPARAWKTVLRTGALFWGLIALNAIFNAA